MSEALTLLGVGMGAALGFGGSFALYKIQRSDQHKEQQVELDNRRKRLIAMLHAEVEQSCELLDIDLQVSVHTPLEDALGEQEASNSAKWGSSLSKLNKLSFLRSIFDAYCDQLIDLPGYSPNALVRFHANIATKSARMVQAAENNDLASWEKLRK